MEELANWVMENLKQFKKVPQVVYTHSSPLHNNINSCFQRKRQLAEPVEELEPIVITLTNGPNRRSILASENMLSSFAAEVHSFYERESRVAFNGTDAEKEVTTQLLHQHFPLVPHYTISSE